MAIVWAITLRFLLVPLLILYSPYALASDRFPLLSGMTVTQVTPASSYVVLLFNIFTNNDIRS